MRIMVLDAKIHTSSRTTSKGRIMPSAGVTYYEVPAEYAAEYAVKDYRYTVVNNRTVLVDPRMHRIVQIIEESIAVV